MATWHRPYFQGLHYLWDNLRKFCYYNRSLVESLFIFLYALEQIVLVILVFALKDSQTLGLLVSIFAIVVLTTFAMHKLLMESRIRILETDIAGLLEEKIAHELKAKYIINKYHELSETFENVAKDLNTIKFTKLRKRF